MKRLLVFVFLAIVCLKLTAQAPDPSKLPLLQQADLQYVGGFRVPQGGVNGFDLSYGGQPTAFNPATNSLFIGSMTQRVTEITIPTPLNNAAIMALPEARYQQQTFADPTDGHMKELTSGSIGLYGLLVDGPRLYGAASPYYDGANEQRVSHFARSTNLTEKSFSGWSQVWQSNRQGFVGGWMAWVPQEWRALLGGPAITGNGALSIITRTSFGPAAFAFDPAKIGQPTVPATPLLYYPGDHPTLGPWEPAKGSAGPNIYFNQTAQIGGVVVITGTRTALFFGRIGVGPVCYGEGVQDKALHGTVAADTVTNCYDPLSASKGPHAYPYRYQVWAYDLNEWATVKAGKKKPWDVRPYAVWPIEQFYPDLGGGIGGVAYDPARQMIYISQLSANHVGCCLMLPVIHAITIKGR